MNIFIPDVMLNVPWYLWPPVGLILLFFFFCVVIALKLMIIRNGWQTNSLAKLAFYILGGRFLYLDALANYLCWSPIALHFPGRFGEDKTITAHARALIKSCTVTHLGKPYPDAGLSWRLRWATRFALFTMRHLHNVDPNGH